MSHRQSDKEQMFEMNSWTDLGQSNVNPLSIAHHYKYHENTNRSRVSQLYKAPIPKYNRETWCYAASIAGSTHEIRTPYLIQAVKIQNSQDHHLSLFGYCKVTRLLIKL